MRFIFIYIISATILLGFSNEQIKKISKAFEIGKKIKAKDGMTFEHALPSIMGQESSWGKAVIGDKFDKTGKLKSVYDSSLGNFQIKLSTAKFTIKRYKELKEKYGYMLNEGKSTYKLYEKYKKRLVKYNNILNNKKWIKKSKNNNKKAINTLKWARIKYLENLTLFNKYRLEAHKDTLLINALINDYEVGADIGGHYLLLCYNEALKKGLKHPYKKAIGKYNGGWNNSVYYPLIMKKMKSVRKLKKTGLLFSSI